MYLLQMCSQTNNHKYYVGCYLSRPEAEFNGLVEVYWRGGKYTYSVVEEHICESMCVKTDKGLNNKIDFFFERCGGYSFQGTIRL